MNKTLYFLLFIVFSSLSFSQNKEVINPFLGEWHYVIETVVANDTIHFPLNIIHKYQKDGKLELIGNMVKPKEKSWTYSFTSDSLFVINQYDSLNIAYSIINKNVIKLHHTYNNEKVFYLFVRNNPDGLKILKKFQSE